VAKLFLFVCGLLETSMLGIFAGGGVVSPINSE
jgi:hypothetical protein